MGVKVYSSKTIQEMEQSKRIKLILDIVKKGDLVMFEGKLHPEEELHLTTKAMESVSGRFSGIEIAHLGDDNNANLIQRLKKRMFKILSGYEQGITVIGPSKQIKEIKMDPNNLEILFK